MSQIRLYVDEDASQEAVIEGLKRHRVDVFAILDSGMVGATDEEQLNFAISENRCLYSLNAADFYRLHSEVLGRGQQHCGIIVIPRQRYSVGEKIRRLLQLIDSVNAEEMINQIEFL